MSGCDTLGRCQPSRIQEDVVSNWEPVHISVEDAGLCDRDCSSPLPSGSGCRTPASMPLAGGRGLFGICSILCCVSRPVCTLESLAGKFSLSLFFPLAIPQFRLLSHICSLRLSSGHSVQVLTLRTDYSAHVSLSSPCTLVANTSVWSTSPLAVAVRRLFCGFLFLFFSWLCCPLKFQDSPTDPPVRGFPTVWKLLLLQDSLQRMALCP